MSGPGAGDATFKLESITLRRRQPRRSFRDTGSPGRSRPPPSSAAKAIQYTCPMHPEIIRDAPGSCPICGMALEPKEATLTEGPNAELVSMTRRFWISAAYDVAYLRAGGERTGARALPAPDTHDLLGATRAGDS